MIIQRINTQSYTNYNNSRKTNVSFQSNRAQDAMMRKLWEQREKEWAEQAAKKRAENERKFQEKMTGLNTLKNYQIDDIGCQNMAQFLLNFTCAIENDSDHSADEFFKSEDEAAKLREKLSPECQKNSIELRKEIQSQPILKDAVLTLIIAKDMKEFVPVDEEFAMNEEYQQTIESAKKAVVDLVETSDKSNFDKAEIELMTELTEIIKTTKGLDFGEDYDEKLQTLLDSIKNRQEKTEEPQMQKKGFIPKIKKMLKIK